MKCSTRFYRLLFIFLSFMSGVCFGASSVPEAADTISLSVQVVVREGQRQTFLHGAEVSIEPLYFDGRYDYTFPVVGTTGNGGLADMGELPSSLVVGDYRVQVSHSDCGNLEKKHFSLKESSRPLTLSLVYTGPCVKPSSTTSIK